MQSDAAHNCGKTLFPLLPRVYFRYKRNARRFDGRSSEAEMIDMVRPGMDVLVLSDGAHRGTLLTSVWDSVPNSGEFIRHLKKKAGLPIDCWSEDIQAFRYTVEQIDASEL